MGAALPQNQEDAAALGSAPAFDTARYRQALGTFATGVTVVTTRTPDGQLAGVTCNSFNSLSLSPPLVLWSLRKDSRSLAAFLEAGHFAVNVLAHDQQAVSQVFASRAEDRFAQVRHQGGLVGLPLIEGAVSRFQCRLVQHQEAGDHVLFIGEVLHFEHHDRPALVFHEGAYSTAGLPALRAVA